MTEAQKRANAKAHKKNTRCFTFRFTKSTDADVIAKLESVPNKQGYIKSLIRADIEKAGS